MSAREFIEALIEMGILASDDAKPKTQKLMDFLGSRKPQTIEERILAIVHEQPGATTWRIRQRFNEGRRPRVADTLLKLVAERKLVCKSGVGGNGQRSVVWFEA